MTDCRTHKNWPLILLEEYEDSTVGDIYPHLAECGILKIIITIAFYATLKFSGIFILLPLQDLG